jgi:hypothetical protein
MSAPLVAVLAAYLGFCFQRRNSYLQALRDLWKILIPAVQRAVQYTHLEQPDPNEFSELMSELSTVIDSLRGIFKNIPGPGVGLYPYEPIKDILTIELTRFRAPISDTSNQEKGWGQIKNRISTASLPGLVFWSRLHLNLKSCLV